MCGNDHVISGPADLLPSGQCRQCDRINQARYRARQRAGLDLLKAYETMGIAVADIPSPHRLRVALAIVNELSPEQVEHLWRMDPDLMRRALANVKAALPMGTAA